MPCLCLFVYIYTFRNCHTHALCAFVYYAGKGHAQPPINININREGPTHNSVHSFFAVDALDGYRESSITVSLDYNIIAETLQAVTVL